MKQFFPFIALVAILAACNTVNPPTPNLSIKRGQVVNYEHRAFVSKERIRTSIADSVPDSLILYDVDAFRLTYGTIQENEPIVTTALILVPKGVKDTQYVAYMHGTNIPMEAFGATAKMPSNYDFVTMPFDNEVLTFALSFAANGRTVIMPDYIGFGPTANKEHVFIYYPELRFQTIDALLAFKEHEHIQHKMPLLIAGWSQGGGAALSLQYYLQRDYKDEFTVLSTAALAGVHHYSALIEYVLKDTTGILPPTMLSTWAVYCVNRFGLHRPNDQIFTNRVTNQVEACLGQVGDVWELFRPAFLSGVLNGTDTEWINVAKSNDFYQGWCPTGKVFLHHGTHDALVPYMNSADAYQGLTQAGGDVTLYTYPNGGHSTHTYTFVKQTIQDWKNLNNQQ